ncbi:hypothetical protein, partial [Limosilactobacillus mucosae]|uniref:hypothetical protein n=1 Tax=Limosilactobacillus mucosae TaxID=97478 RepID=UPI00053C2A20
TGHRVSKSAGKYWGYFKRFDQLDDWLSQREFVDQFRQIFQCAGFIHIYVKGGFELSFYGGLKMHDLGGLRINRC